MAEYLFTIQEIFELEVFGLIAATDVKTKDAKLEKNNEIELRRVDGSSLVTKVKNIPMLSPYDAERLFSFSLPKDINKKDVPIGTEVWSHP